MKKYTATPFSLKMSLKEIRNKIFSSVRFKIFSFSTRSYLSFHSTCVRAYTSGLGKEGWLWRQKKSPAIVAKERLRNLFSHGPISVTTRCNLQLFGTTRKPSSSSTWWCQFQRRSVTFTASATGVLSLWSWLHPPNVARPATRAFLPLTPTAGVPPWVQLPSRCQRILTATDVASRRFFHFFNSCSGSGSSIVRQSACLMANREDVVVWNKLKMSIFRFFFFSRSHSSSPAVQRACARVWGVKVVPRMAPV